MSFPFSGENSIGQDKDLSTKKSPENVRQDKQYDELLPFLLDIKPYVPMEIPKSKATLPLDNSSVYVDDHSILFEDDSLLASDIHLTPAASASSSAFTSPVLSSRNMSMVNDMNNLSNNVTQFVTPLRGDDQDLSGQLNVSGAQYSEDVSRFKFSSHNLTYSTPKQELSNSHSGNVTFSPAQDVLQISSLQDRLYREEMGQQDSVEEIVEEDEDITFSTNNTVDEEVQYNTMVNYFNGIGSDLSGEVGNEERDGLLSLDNVMDGSNSLSPENDRVCEDNLVGPVEEGSVGDGTVFNKTDASPPKQNISVEFSPPLPHMSPSSGLHGRNSAGSSAQSSPVRRISMNEDDILDATIAPVKPGKSLLSKKNVSYHSHERCSQSPPKERRGNSKSSRNSSPSPQSPSQSMSPRVRSSVDRLKRTNSAKRESSASVVPGDSVNSFVMDLNTDKGYSYTSNEPVKPVFKSNQMILGEYTVLNTLPDPQEQEELAMPENYPALVDNSHILYDLYARLQYTHQQHVATHAALQALLSEHSNVLSQQQNTAQRGEFQSEQVIELQSLHKATIEKMEVERKNNEEHTMDLSSTIEEQRTSLHILEKQRSDLLIDLETVMQVNSDQEANIDVISAEHQVVLGNARVYISAYNSLITVCNDLMLVQHNNHLEYLCIEETAVLKQVIHNVETIAVDVQPMNAGLGDSLGKFNPSDMETDAMRRAYEQEIDQLRKQLLQLSSSDNSIEQDKPNEDSSIDGTLHSKYSFANIGVRTVQEALEYVHEQQTAMKTKEQDLASRESMLLENMQRYAEMSEQIQQKQLQMDQDMDALLAKQAEVEQESNQVTAARDSLTFEKEALWKEREIIRYSRLALDAKKDDKHALHTDNSASAPAIASTINTSVENYSSDDTLDGIQDDDTSLHVVVSPESLSSGHALEAVDCGHEDIIFELRVLLNQQYVEMTQREQEVVYLREELESKEKQLSELRVDHELIIGAVNEKDAVDRVDDDMVHDSIDASINNNHLKQVTCNIDDVDDDSIRKTSMNAKYTQLQDEIEHLRANLSTLTGKQDSASSDNSKLVASNVHLLENNNILRVENTKLTNQVHGLEDTMSVQESKIHSMDMSISNHIASEKRSLEILHEKEHEYAQTVSQLEQRLTKPVCASVGVSTVSAAAISIDAMTNTFLVMQHSGVQTELLDRIGKYIQTDSTETVTVGCQCESTEVDKKNTVSFAGYYVQKSIQRVLQQKLNELSSLKSTKSQKTIKKNKKKKQQRIDEEYPTLSVDPFVLLKRNVNNSTVLTKNTECTAVDTDDRCIISNVWTQTDTSIPVAVYHIATQTEHMSSDVSCGSDCSMDDSTANIAGEGIENSIVTTPVLANHTLTPILTPSQPTITVTNNDMCTQTKDHISHHQNDHDTSNHILKPVLYDISIQTDIVHPHAVTSTQNATQTDSTLVYDNSVQAMCETVHTSSQTEESNITTIVPPSTLNPSPSDSIPSSHLDELENVYHELNKQLGLQSSMSILHATQLREKQMEIDMLQTNLANVQEELGVVRVLYEKDKTLLHDVYKKDANGKSVEGEIRKNRALIFELDAVKESLSIVQKELSETQEQYSAEKYQHRVCKDEMRKLELENTRIESLLKQSDEKLTMVQSNLDDDHENSAERNDMNLPSTNTSSTSPIKSNSVQAIIVQRQNKNIQQEPHSIPISANAVSDTILNTMISTLTVQLKEKDARIEQQNAQVHSMEDEKKTASSVPIYVNPIPAKQTKASVLSSPVFSSFDDTLHLTYSDNSNPDDTDVLLEKPVKKRSKESSKLASYKLQEKLYVQRAVELRDALVALTSKNKVQEEKDALIRKIGTALKEKSTAYNGLVDSLQKVGVQVQQLHGERDELMRKHAECLAQQEAKLEVASLYEARYNDTLVEQHEETQAHKATQEELRNPKLGQGMQYVQQMIKKYFPHRAGQSWQDQVLVLLREYEGVVEQCRQLGEQEMQWKLLSEEYAANQREFHELKCTTERLEQQLRSSEDRYTLLQTSISARFKEEHKNAAVDTIIRQKADNLAVEKEKTTMQGVLDRVKADNKTLQRKVKEYEDMHRKYTELLSTQGSQRDLELKHQQELTELKMVHDVCTKEKSQLYEKIQSLENSIVDAKKLHIRDMDALEDTYQHSVTQYRVRMTQLERSSDEQRDLLIKKYEERLRDMEQLLTVKSMQFKNNSDIMIERSAKDQLLLVNTLQTEITEYKTLLEKAETEKTQLMTKMKDLTHELENSVERHTHEQRKYKDSKTIAVNEIEQNMLAWQKEKERIQRIHEQECTFLKNSVSELQSRLSTHDGLLRDMKLEVERREVTIHDLRSSLLHEEERYKALSSDITAARKLEHTLAERNERVATLEHEIEILKTDLVHSDQLKSSDLRLIENKCRMLTRERAQLVRLQEKQTTDIDARVQERVNTLDELYRAAKIDAEEKNVRLTEMHTRQTDLQSQLDETSISLHTQQQQSIAFETVAQSHTRTIADLEEQLAHKHEEIVQLETKINNLEKSITELEDNAVFKDAECTRLQSYVSLSEGLEATCRSNGQEILRLLSLQASQEQKMAQLTQEKQTADNTAKQYSELQTQFSSMQTQYAKQQSTYQDAQEAFVDGAVYHDVLVERDELRKQSELLTAAISKLEEQQEATKQQTYSLSSKHEQLKRENHDLKLKFNNFHDRYGTMKSELTTECTRLQQSWHALSEDHQRLQQHTQDLQLALDSTDTRLRQAETALVEKEQILNTLVRNK